jgi:hypothetical protein
MKTKIAILITACLFINLFSSFALCAPETNGIAQAALTNTMHVAKDLFVSACVSATLDMVMGKVAPLKIAASSSKNKTDKKSKANKDFAQTFFIQTTSNYSSSISESRICSNYISGISIDKGDLNFTILLQKFRQGFFVFFLLYISLLYLLPRGATDSYAIGLVYRRS